MSDIITHDRDCDQAESDGGRHGKQGAEPMAFGGLDELLCLFWCERFNLGVLYAKMGHGTRLKFDRNGEDHFYTCTGAKRLGVNRKWTGQHRATKSWETPE